MSHVFWNKVDIFCNSICCSGHNGYTVPEDIFFLLLRKVMAFESQRPLFQGTFCTPKSNNISYLFFSFHKNTKTMRQFLLFECDFGSPKAQDMVRDFEVI